MLDANTLLQHAVTDAIEYANARTAAGETGWSKPADIAAFIAYRIREQAGLKVTASPKIRKAATDKWLAELCGSEQEKTDATKAFAAAREALRIRRSR